MEPIRTSNFKLNVEEYLDFIDRVVDTKKNKITRVVVGCFGVILIILPFADMFLSTVEPSFGSIPIGILLVFYSFYCNPKRLHRAWFKKYSDSAFPQSTLTIQDDGILEVTPVTEIRFKWEAFQKFSETEAALGLHKGWLVYIYPKRAFTPTQLEEFKNALAKKIPPWA